MSSASSVIQSFHEKIRAHIRGLRQLLDHVPGEHLAWQPEPRGDGRPFVRLDELLGHHLECLAGFCAVLQRARPERLSHFSLLEKRPRNHRCSLEEARQEISVYQRYIDEGFGLLTDDDLRRELPTVLQVEPRSVSLLLLDNLEHLSNHKYQLFFYLRLLGVPVGTPELYGLTNE